MRISIVFIVWAIITPMFVFGQKPRVYKAPKMVDQWNYPGIQPDRIIVSFGEDPASQLNFNWRTDTTVSQGYVEIAVATAAPKFWRNATTHISNTEYFNTKISGAISSSAHYHSLELSNLLPNTLYAYRVGDGEHWSEWFQVKTASKEPGRFSFLYVGDAQNFVLELWSRLIRQGFQKAPDARFFIHAGDLINRANVDSEWEEWFTAGGFIHAMIPSFAVPGNHEYYWKDSIEGRKLSELWKPQFNLPKNGPDGLQETVFYMDYQGARIIGLNSNEQLDVQIKWLEKILQNNPNKWTIVTYHHPLFSASGGRDNEEWRSKLKPVLDKYHVDLALQGHDHAYARGRTQPFEYNIPDGVNKRDLTGTVYVVSVSGGKMYALRPNAWDGWDADRERAAENTQLFQVIDIDGDILRYESYTAVGELYDAFEIIKNENGPNRFIELQHQAISGRYHNNTIPYADQLPLELKEKILLKFPNAAINRVDMIEDDKGNIIYNVVIRKNEVNQTIKITENGLIMME